MSDRVRSAAELGETISRRLFTVGLDLSYVQMTLDPDSLAAARVRHATEEVDAAIASVRHLMVEWGLHDTLAMCQQDQSIDLPPSPTQS
jgi:signal transduction histidine kinase